MAFGVNCGSTASSHRSRFEGRLPRVLAAAFLVLWTAARVASPVGAEERYSVRTGQTVFNFNVDLLRDLGIELVIEADSIEPLGDLMLEEPCWTFPIQKGSDLGFRSEYGAIGPGGLEGSVLKLGGAITIRDRATGKQARFDGLEIARMPATDGDAPGRHGTETLYLRSGATQQIFCELVHSMFDFRSKGTLKVHYLNVRFPESMGRQIGRPDIAGWVVGCGEIRAGVKLISSTPPTAPRHVPKTTAAFIDVGLGDLTAIQQVGHIGTFPAGTAGLSLETTICNFGDEVPWEGPMDVNHPLIHMGLYRLLNGRLEQVGISWLKHGFFALSNSQCTSCMEQTDGSYLGIGCSDTYAVSNNSNRSYLGPRNEVNPYTAVWTCVGSHFSDGLPDCVRRHTSSSGHTATDHRLIVADADLANAGATYYYEACYYVREDQALTNNWGSRRCTMSWNGSLWNFTTPGSMNPLLAGPALERWGELRTLVPAAAGDGQVELAVQTTDLGGGTYHYEYALLNRNADRQLRSFSLPVNGVANLANIGFHDNDSDPSNDWAVSVANGVITWQCPTFATDPNAHALVFGNMMNFRFDANAVPVNRDATLGLFKPGTGTEVAAATRGPEFGVAGVEDDGVAATRPRLIDMRPNPFNHSTAISYELPMAGSVTLEIYDAAGRHVRTLIDGGRDAGVHSSIWDGNGDNGTRVRAGVYHARLRAGSTTSVRSLILVN